MEETNLKKAAWREAATGGLILGAIFIVIIVAEYFIRLEPSYAWVTGALNFFSIIAVSYIYARKVSNMYGAAGFTYPQSIGFILKMMLFAGVLAGIGQFVMQTYVDPEYYRELIERTLTSQGFSDELVNEAVEAMWTLKNPLMMVFSGMLSMVVYGGLIGLFVSAFVKRPANPFFGNNDNSQKPE